MHLHRRQAVNDAATVFGTAHFDDYQQQGGSLAAYTSVGALAGAWHVYALEWTLESLHWCGALPHALRHTRMQHVHVPAAVCSTGEREQACPPASAMCCCLFSQAPALQKYCLLMGPSRSLQVMWFMPLISERHQLRTQVCGRRANGVGLPALHRAQRLVQQRARGRGRLCRALRPALPPAGVLPSVQDYALATPSAVLPLFLPSLPGFAVAPFSPSSALAPAAVRLVAAAAGTMC